MRLPNVTGLFVGTMTGPAFRNQSRSLSFASYSGEGCEPSRPQVPIVLYGQAGCSFDDLPASITPWDFWEPTPDELNLLRRTHDQIVALDPSHRRLARSLELFWRVSDPQRLGMFYFVGLMAVVECLLTHSSSGRDDAISRQVRHKVPLLLRRANYLVNPFPCTLEEAWKQLYGLRSTIAHGEQPVFGQGGLSSIADHAKASDYLASAVNILLRQALVEPVLIEDLAKC